MHRRIGRYAAIGNLETCPIVGADGSIDWCCFPGISSPSVFAAILDDEIGGRFRIAPAVGHGSRQEYVDGTNILKTRFTIDESVPADGGGNSVGRGADGDGRSGVLTDFMQIRTDMGGDPDPLPYRAIYRRVEAEDAPIEFGISFSPRFNYAQQPTDIHPVDSLLDDGVSIPTGGSRDIESMCERAFIASPRATGPVEGITSEADTVAAGPTRGIGAAQSMYLQLPEGAVSRVESVTPERTDRATPEADGGVERMPPSSHPNETLTATVTVEPENPRWFCLQYGQAVPLTASDGTRLLNECRRRWRRWSDRIAHRDGTGPPGIGGPVERSALVLKLLMTQRTGAIAAAPTTSIPEAIGGSRNWDYRFNWIRDSALAVRALYRLGHEKEARRYLRWCLGLSLADTDGFDPEGTLYRPLSRMDGSYETGEITLDHLDGYRDSRPVRIGNGADDQHQLDVYGYLADAVHEAARHSDSFTAEVSRGMRELADHVCRVWTQPDAGIWEVRDGPSHFVHSKLMCWLALDRAISLVQTRQLDGLHATDDAGGDERAFESRADRENAVSKWADERTSIREEIIERGYSEEAESFVRSYGDDTTLDATALYIPLVGFLDASDERVVSTVEAVRDRLGTDDGFVYRYRTHDGIEGGENPFVPCSFWMVEALATIGRMEEARSLYDSLIARRSAPGLFAEEYAPSADEHRGNYPQAFSHIGVIDAAVTLREEHARRANEVPSNPRQPDDVRTR